MRLKAAESVRYSQLLQGVADHEVCLQMKNYVQHGSMTTYDHCAAVAEACFVLNRQMHLGADEASLVRAAFLHDLYLYDWHVKDRTHRLHGYHHADTALRNAQRYFQLNEKEKRMIYCHMWPLNLSRVPDSREALILCICDKYCALLETLRRG